MTFLELSRRSAWRKPLRTVLLMFSIAVAFIIYALTASFLAGSQAGGQVGENRLIVTNQAGAGQTLPLSYLSRITEERGVRSSFYTTRIRGFVDNEKNVVVVAAADPTLMAPVMARELGLTTDLIKGLGQARDHILVGRALAQAQGWTTGQRISVSAFQMAQSDGSRDWSFEIAGVFDGENAGVDTYFAMARYDHVNAIRARGKDSVDMFVVEPAEGTDASALAPQIDRLFANSAAQTKTQPEKQFLEAFLRQIADIGAIINLVVGAAFATILMIVVNTMVFSVRERTFEIALLKTLGFSPPRVLALVLCETLLVFVIGAMAGTIVAATLPLFVDASLGLNFTPLVAAKAIVIAICLGLFAGILPAVNAMRMPISNALKAR